MENTSTGWKSYVWIVAAAAAMGLSYQVFVFPNAFAPAGINGLATIVQYLFHVNIGSFSLIVNIPLLLLAWKKVGHDFARKNLVFVAAFSLVNLVLGRMDLHFLTYYNPNGNSAILGPVAAGVVSGAVYGCAIRHGGATGGTDVVAAWVRRKRPEASLVWLIFALNSSVAVLSFFVYGCQFEPVIMCLVYCFLSSRISDAMLKGGKRALKFEVITKDAEALAAQLIRELRHSVTMLPALGMYTKQEYSLLVCVVNRHQIVRFQEILQGYPGTFAYISNVNEALGNFKHITD